MYTIKPLLILKVWSKADEYKKAHHEMVIGQILLYGFGPITPEQYVFFLDSIKILGFLFEINRDFFALEMTSY